MQNFSVDYVMREIPAEHLQTGSRGIDNSDKFRTTDVQRNIVSI